MANSDLSQITGDMIKQIHDVLPLIWQYVAESQNAYKFFINAPIPANSYFALHGMKDILEIVQKMLHRQTVLYCFDVFGRKHSVYRDQNINELYYENLDGKRIYVKEPENYDRAIMTTELCGAKYVMFVRSCEWIEYHYIDGKSVYQDSFWKCQKPVQTNSHSELRQCKLFKSGCQLTEFHPIMINNRYQTVPNRESYPYDHVLTHHVGTRYREMYVNLTSTDHQYENSGMHLYYDKKFTKYVNMQAFGQTIYELDESGHIYRAEFMPEHPLARYTKPSWKK